MMVSSGGQCPRVDKVHARTEVRKRKATPPRGPCLALWETAPMTAGRQRALLVRAAALMSTDPDGALELLNQLRAMPDAPLSGRDRTIENWLRAVLDYGPDGAVAYEELQAAVAVGVDKRMIVEAGLLALERRDLSQVRALLAVAAELASSGPTIEGAVSLLAAQCVMAEAGDDAEARRAAGREALIWLVPVRENPLVAPLVGLAHLWCGGPAAAFTVVRGCQGVGELIEAEGASVAAACRMVSGWPGAAEDLGALRSTCQQAADAAAVLEEARLRRGDSRARADAEQYGDLAWSTAFEAADRAGDVGGLARLVEGRRAFGVPLVGPDRHGGGPRHIGNRHHFPIGRVEAIALPWDQVSGSDKAGVLDYLVFSGSLPDC